MNDGPIVGAWGSHDGVPVHIPSYELGTYHGQIDAVEVTNLALVQVMWDNKDDFDALPPAAVMQFVQETLEGVVAMIKERGPGV